MSDKKNPIRDTVLYAPKNGFDTLSAKERKEMEKYNEDYKKFLSVSKTERKCVHSAIALAEKKELNKKLEDFRNERDTMEEVFENKEQIEISKYYEKQPKPDLVAISEFENGELFYRRANKEDEKSF